MRRCFLVDLKLGRRLLWGVWLGEGGMRIKATENMYIGTRKIFVVDDELLIASQV